MITTPAPTQWRMSRIEYRQLGDLGAFQSKRVQLINGQVIEMSPMGSPHATSVALCDTLVRRIFGEGYTIRCQLPLVLSEWSEPEPDIAVVLGTTRDFETDHPTTAELVIEVADSSVALDRDVKSIAYAEAGVKEHWLVNLPGRCVELFRDPDPTVGNYRDRSVIKEGASFSVNFGRMTEIAVSELLPRGR